MLRAELDALQKRLQVPMVLITHDPEDVQVFGEQVLQVRGGAIELQTGAAQALASVQVSV